MTTKIEQLYSSEWERDPALDLTAEEVARLTRPEREARVRALIAESHAILDGALRFYVTTQDKRHVGTALLYSGGNDSTTLAHMMRGWSDWAIHANTGIGIEQTREFVRKTCAEWGLPLIEKSPPAGSTYRELVLDQGFPGPGQHFKMFQRLKERAIMAARAELVTQPRRERIVFLAGRRKDESVRRANIPLWEREGSIIWVSPMVFWTKLDLNTYRVMCGDVPVNEASSLIHMSGECLCGSFAHKGELEEVAQFYPEVAAEIQSLEAEVRAAGQIKPERCRWGWGAYRESRPKASKVGVMCTSCDDRYHGGETVAMVTSTCQVDGE